MKKICMISLFMSLALSLLSTNLYSQNKDINVKESPKSLFVKGKLGMFFHYGVYSAIAGKYVGPTLDGGRYTTDDPFISDFGAEWIMYGAKIPRSEYKKYADKFTASAFDASAWMKLAKQMGAKYVILTVKHHEGFLLYPSSISDWCTTNSMAKGRDIVGEFLNAAKDEGLMAGIYFSQNQDWMENGGMGDIPELNFKRYTDQQQSVYVEKTCRVLSEILDRYGKLIDIYWWDIPGVNTNKQFSDRFMSALTSHPNYKKDAIHNDRMTFYEGDFATPEMTLEETPTRPFELCSSTIGSWGYTPYLQVKGLGYVLGEMIKALSFGGNYLLNIPPKENGTFSSKEEALIGEVGDYVRKNAEAIYETEKTNLAIGQDFGWVTRKGNTFYLHVLARNEKVEFQGIGGDIQSATLLDGTEMPYTTTKNGFLFESAKQFDVIKVVFDTPRINKRIVIPAESDYALTTMSAHNNNFLWIEPYNNYSGITSRLIYPITWNVDVKSPGEYTLYLTYGSSYNDSIRIGQKEGHKTFQYPPTGDSFQFKEVNIGTMTLNKGENQISISQLNNNDNIMFSKIRFVKSHPDDSANYEQFPVIEYNANTIRIKMPSNFSVRIYGMDGKIKSGKNAFQECEVDVSGYMKDIYILDITDQSKRYTRKMRIK